MPLEGREIIEAAQGRPYDFWLGGGKIFWRPITLCKNAGAQKGRQIWASLIERYKLASFRVKNFYKKIQKFLQNCVFSAPSEARREFFYFLLILVKFCCLFLKALPISARLSAERKCSELRRRFNLSAALIHSKIIPRAKRAAENFLFVPRFLQNKAKSCKTPEVCAIEFCRCIIPHRNFFA